MGFVLFFSLSTVGNITRGEIVFACSLESLRYAVNGKGEKTDEEKEQKSKD